MAKKKRRGLPLENAGAPVNGTSEVQTLTQTGSPTGGTFKLSFDGYETASIAYDADAATIQAALEALPSIGTGGVTGGGGPLNTTPVTVTFAGNLGKKAVPLMTLSANALTGGTTPTVGIAETTPGVDATGRGAPKAALLLDTTNAKLYINTGTALAPTWVVTGTQT
jgi:hypothetical protein